MTAMGSVRYTWISSAILACSLAGCVLSQCTKPSSGTTTPRPDDLATGAPTWFKECSGFGCRVTQSYDHTQYTKCCVEDLNQESLMACLSNDYVHVIFAQSGTITLNSTVTTRTGLILDGTWHNVVISGAALSIKGYTIIRRIGFANSDFHALFMSGPYSWVWIHKCSFSHSAGKNIVMSRGFTGVTISNNLMFDSGEEEPIQISTSARHQPLDSLSQVTIHNNYFKDIKLAAPWVRFAYVHAFNNVYEQWNDFAIGCSNLARCYIEGNSFESGNATSRNIVETVDANEPAGDIMSQNNLLISPGTRELNVDESTVPTPPYVYNMVTMTSAVRASVVKRAGAGFELPPSNA